MIFDLFRKLFRSRSERVVGDFRGVVAVINAMETTIESLSDSELSGKTVYFRDLLVRGSSQNDILPEAFAVVREVSKRLLNMRHYDVQLIGGMVLNMGCIAEMKTGEGKTLVATLVAYLNALSGRVHVVTVNDYLTERDYAWMSRIYSFLGLTVGKVTGQTPRDARKQEYNSDIVYVTNSELGFDYLRDNMQLRLEHRVLPDDCFDYAIVDEIDSILIDEARTPLIISGPSNKSSDIYQKVDKIVRQFDKKYYEIHEKTQSIQMTEDGAIEMEVLLKSAGLIPNNGGLYDLESCEIINHVLQSLKAHHIMSLDKDYIVIGNEALLIDEFTGRVSEGRRYSGGLHQAIEAKEGIKIRSENQTLASVTYQNFFRMYKKLSGMTGTAVTEAKELYSIYKLEVITIPTYKPTIRKDNQDGVFRNAADKLAHIVSLVKERHSVGQPVLIGTVSILKSEELSRLLTRENVKHNVLNAKNHVKEAEIIAQAGRKGAVTIATNMAGRGTDILLGGNRDARILEAISGVSDADEIKEITDRMRAEHTDERDEVIALGGLLVIGSERHESRRIDNQLRGRSGRLGDPGESQFFLSLDDELLRIFGGERVSGMLNSFGFEDRDVIYSPMLNSVILKSQKKLENLHYDMRKNVLKYDDTINEQRHFVYDQRLSFTRLDDLSVPIRTIVNSVVKYIIESSYDVSTSTFDYSRAVDLLVESCGLRIKNSVEELLHINVVISGDNLNSIVSEVEALVWSAYEKKAESHGEFRVDAERYVLLQTIDECWKEHLNNINHIREGIHLRAYGNKDPFVEYRLESFNALEMMFHNFEHLCLYRLFSVVTKPSDCIRDVFVNDSDVNDMLRSIPNAISALSSVDSLGVGNVSPSSDLLSISSNSSSKLHRNSPCPCGSGKKYKHCHLQ